MHTNDKLMPTVLYVKAVRPSWAVQGSKLSTQEAGAQGQPVYTWISEATETKEACLNKTTSK